MKYTMHKTAVTFAVKHHIRLGQYHGGMMEGYYFVRSDAGAHTHVSFAKTARSAVAMMKRFLRGEKK